jgi:hypothetical protein
MKLNLPTYFTKIKQPMDLGTVKSKLQTGEYTSIEAVETDVELVFKNALQFNTTKSTVYVAAKVMTKLANAEIQAVTDRLAKENLRKQGHSCALCGGETCGLCGEKCLKFEAPVIICQGPCGLRIKRNSTYFVSKDGSCHLCHKCHQSSPARIGDSRGPDCKPVMKWDLMRRRTDEEVAEPWVSCDQCGGWVHQICSLFCAAAEQGHDIEKEALRAKGGIVPEIDEGFSCPSCKLAAAEKAVVAAGGKLLRDEDREKILARQVAAASKVDLTYDDDEDDDDEDENDDDDDDDDDGDGADMDEENDDDSVAEVKMATDPEEESQWSAKNLPKTHLSNFLEALVTARLLEEGFDPDVGESVTVRMVSNLDKKVDVPAAVRNNLSLGPCVADDDDGMEHSELDTEVKSEEAGSSSSSSSSSSRGNKLPESMPYRQKGILLFQRIDGVDVNLFSVYVQEYGDDCPEPNRNRVYVAYLDSVEFFRPTSARTAVYHEVLIGYLRWSQMRGFKTAHIWACPPHRGDNFIFWCHPPYQKTPSRDRLNQWYDKMLERAFLLGVITKKESLRDTHFGSLTELFCEANKLKEQEREQERVRSLQAQQTALIARAVARGGSAADVLASSSLRDRTRNRNRNRSRSRSRVRGGSTGGGNGGRRGRKPSNSLPLTISVPPPPAVGPDGQPINEYPTVNGQATPSVLDGARLPTPSATPGSVCSSGAGMKSTFGGSLGLSGISGASGAPLPEVKRGRGRPRTVSLGSPMASTPGATSGLGAVWQQGHGDAEPLARAVPQLMQRSLSNAVIESLVEDLPLDGEPSAWLRFCPPIFDGDFFLHEFLRSYKTAVEKDRELTGRNDAVNARKARELLRMLMQQTSCAPFNHPVDPDALNIPEYRSLIARPMDLGTVRNNLKTHMYSNILELARDVRLTFDNALRFNPPGHPVHEAAIDLARAFSIALSQFVTERIRSAPPPGSGVRDPHSAAATAGGLSIRAAVAGDPMHAGNSNSARSSPRSPRSTSLTITAPGELGHRGNTVCTSPMSSGGGNTPPAGGLLLTKCTDGGLDPGDLNGMPSVHECGLYHGPKRCYNDDSSSDDGEGEGDDRDDNDENTAELDEGEYRSDGSQPGDVDGGGENGRGGDDGGVAQGRVDPTTLGGGGADLGADLRAARTPSAKFIPAPHRLPLELPTPLREVDAHLVSYPLGGASLSKRRSLSSVCLQSSAGAEGKLDSSVDGGLVQPLKRIRTPRSKLGDEDDLVVVKREAVSHAPHPTPPPPPPVDKSGSGGFFGFFRSSSRAVQQQQQQNACDAASTSGHSSNDNTSLSGEIEGSEDWSEHQLGLDLNSEDGQNRAVDGGDCGGGGGRRRHRDRRGEPVDMEPIPDGPLGSTGTRALLAELAMSLEKFKDDLFVVSLRDPEESVDLVALAETLESAKAALDAKVPPMPSLVPTSAAGSGEGEVKMRDPIVPARWFKGARKMLTRAVGTSRDTSDPDTLIGCPIVDSRHVFLEMGMFKNAQFDTLRRAKASSLQLMYNLRHPHAEHMRPHCSDCGAVISKGSVRWHCDSCPGYDLCVSCAETERPRPADWIYPPSTPSGRSMLAGTLPAAEKYKCCLYHDLTPFPVNFGP